MWTAEPPSGGGRRRRARAVGAVLLCAAVCLVPAASSAQAAAPVSGGPQVPVASAPGEPGAHPAAATEEHGLSQKAVEIARPFGFPITNSMVVTWPSPPASSSLPRWRRGGRRRCRAARRTSWSGWWRACTGFWRGSSAAIWSTGRSGSLPTIFISILSANWFGLLPGSARSAGAAHRGGLRDRSAAVPRRQCRSQPDAGDGPGVLRAPGSSGRCRSRLAACSTSCSRQGRHERPDEAAHGGRVLRRRLLEIVSILFRPVSLSFRLYGNVFAGENMLETMATLVPGLGWLLPIRSTSSELLVGLVQAMVFMLLTAVFTLLICQHEEGTPATLPD